MALASLYNLHVYYMDVKKVFLNDDFTEEVYMKQSAGFAWKRKWGIQF